MLIPANLDYRSYWNVQQARDSPKILSGNHFRPRTFASERLRLAGLGRALHTSHAHNVSEGEPKFRPKILMKARCSALIRLYFRSEIMAPPQPRTLKIGRGSMHFIWQSYSSPATSKHPLALR